MYVIKFGKPLILNSKISFPCKNTWVGKNVFFRKNKSLTLSEPGYAEKRLGEVLGIWTSEKIRNLENFVGEFFEDCHSASQLLIVGKIQYNRNYADIMAELSHSDISHRGWLNIQSSEKLSCKSNLIIYKKNIHTFTHIQGY